MSATKDESQEENTAPKSTSSRAWRFLKIAVPVAVGLGTMAACVLFPPAALFLAPAVEFLALSVIPATVGLYAGLIAFGTITTSLAIAAALATGLLMSATASVFKAIAKCCTSEKSMDEEGTHYDANNNDDDDEEAALSRTRPNAGRSRHFENPVRQNTAYAEPGAKQEQTMSM